ncbi:MAG TPA: HIT family protein [Candidatus Saccharibacteria bacterium]|jgi:histidine triad (HIT) family protein|nr:HIT family protein [Candidatus Saccharibacteria bacterium]HMT55909.1 HIT family protein [Candidatus Saccharibacteria bacterium]
MGTIFDKIISGEWSSFKVYEDETYLAFLTPYPSTPGLTVVIPKINSGDYIFDVEDSVYHGLLDISKKIAKKIENGLGVSRVALVVEGTGVAHVHVKLYPLHGELAGKTNVWSKHVEFHPNYIGYLTTVEGPKMSDEELESIRTKIAEAQG